MSMQYVFSINGQDFIIQCPDPHVLEKLFNYAPECSENIFGVEAEKNFPVSTPTATVNSDQLIDSIDELLLLLRSKKDIIPYTYRLQDERFAGKSTSKGISGIRLPADEIYFYSLFARENTCILQKWGENDAGLGVCIEKQDVGHLKCLETSNMGMIKILKRRRRLPLSSDLKKLKKSLEELDSGIVTKRLV